MNEKTEIDLSELNRRIAEDPENAMLYVERGKELWRIGRRGEAMSDYQRAAAIDPEGPGKLLVEHSNQIMDFFNPDLLNP